MIIDEYRSENQYFKYKTSKIKNNTDIDGHINYNLIVLNKLLRYHFAICLPYLKFTIQSIKFI